jgi:MerR family transcriptional regulator, light-induced transcriptional regulator
VAPLTLQTGDGASLSVAAVARRLGLAPATLRTWDRRYGVGPSDHRPGAHRRYTEADVARLDAMRRLLLQGVTAAQAARAVTGSSPAGAPATGDGAGAAPPSGSLDVTARQLRETALRLDADRLVALLTRAVRQRGVTDTWEQLLRPVLGWLGNRWAADGSCIAYEHLLSECATRVLHQTMDGDSGPTVRPVLLLSAPGEAHVLPLHALAAALAERSVPSRLLGAATPPQALVTAARLTQPIAVVVWSQCPETADATLFAQLPPSRGGRRLAAAGPGWDQDRLPSRVTRLSSLPAAVAFVSAPA